MGTKPDMKTREKDLRVDDENRRFDIETARRLIFESGVRINSERIDTVLGGSGVPTRVCSLSVFNAACYPLTLGSPPTQNAFSKLALVNEFNIFAILLVDLLHEFEAGVWRAIFAHLVRLLIAIKGTALDELNER